MSTTQDFYFSGQVLSTLFSVTNKLQVQGDSYLQDLTLRQMLAIPAIIHAPEGKATINHIARSLGTTKQSARQIVEAMEKKSYVSLEPSEQDRRAINVTVTQEGRHAFSACSERTDLFLADLFAEFSTEELEMFSRLLKKLYRFDGKEQNQVAVPKGQPLRETDLKLHHPNYLKRRTAHHA